MKLDKLSGFLKKKKKLVALSLVAVLVLGSGAGILARRKAAARAGGEALDFARTVFLAKGDLNNSVNVSGTVESAEVSSVATTLNAKVTAVNVKVGDLVKKGDIICTLASDELQKEISEKKSALGDEAKKLGESYDKARRAVDEAKTAKQRELASQDALVAAAKQALDSAAGHLSAYATDYNTAKANYDLMMGALAASQSAADAAEATKQTAYSAWIAAGGTAEGELYTAYTAAEADAATKQAELTAAKSLYSYDHYAAAFSAAEQENNTRAAANSAAQGTYDTAVSTRTRTMNEIDSNIASLTETMLASHSALKKGSAQTELDELIKKLDQTVLKAETDGKITELKVTVGSMGNGPIATIQSTEKLVVSVRIAEYDISKVKTGMTAIIQSDASTEKLSGIVTRISPTAATGEASGFSADITVTHPEGLFIGTKAKAEIVIDSKSDVFTVPLDAIKTDDAGKTFLRAKQADGSFSDLAVTTGVKNDYYIEVSGSEVKEGLEVLADASWSDLSAATDASVSQMEQ